MKRLWAPWRLEYIQKPDECGCIFCVDLDSESDREKLIVARGAHCYVMMNRYPYANGHLMISPYRHVSNPSDFVTHEILEIHQLMVNSQKVLIDVCSAQGFNVGWNIGASAGAGIASHAHMHVVPRWTGDSNFMPVLSETRVIPEHIESAYLLLVEAFQGL